MESETEVVQTPEKDRNYKETAFVIVEDSKTKRVLCVQRSKDHKWSITGGVVDHNEDKSTAAAREAQEEASVIVNPQSLLFLKNFEITYKLKKKQAVGKRAVYWTNQFQSIENFQPDKEIIQSQWLSWEQITKMNENKQFAKHAHMTELINFMNLVRNQIEQ